MIDLYRKTTFSTRACRGYLEALLHRRRPSICTHRIVRSRARDRGPRRDSDVYRILKAYDLIPSPAFVVLAAKSFRHPTRRPNELWQTDFTYLQVVGWGWYYLSTVLDDYARYIIAWMLRMSMLAADVKETLDLARAKTGIDRVRVVHRPRLLSDNEPCYVSGEYHLE